MAKYDYANLELNILKLYTEYTQDQWNAFLTDCFNKRDINRLIITRIGLQKGADTLARQKLNAPKINEFYLRLLRSLEITAKKIIKLNNPTPTNHEEKQKYIEMKKKQDNDFEKFILRSSY